MFCVNSNWKHNTDVSNSVGGMWHGAEKLRSEGGSG